MVIGYVGEYSTFSYFTSVSWSLIECTHGLNPLQYLSALFALHGLLSLSH